MHLIKVQVVNQPIQGMQFDAFDFHDVSIVRLQKEYMDLAMAANWHLHANKVHVFRQYWEIQIEVGCVLVVLFFEIAMKVEHVNSMSYRYTKIDQKERPESNQ